MLKYTANVINKMHNDTKITSANHNHGHTDILKADFI